MSKPTKSEIKAYTDKLTGASPSTEMVPFEAQAAMAAVDGDALSFVGMPTQEDVQRTIAEATFVAPVYVKIKPGQQLVGVLESTGSMELTRADKRTGEITTSVVKTYVVSLPNSPKVRGWFLGAYELDRALESVPANGTMKVTIWRGNDEDFDGGRVSRYRVVAMSLGGGKTPAAEAA